MARGNQQQSASMSLVWLILIGILVGWGWMIWHRWHGYISYWALKWVWYQLALFDWPIAPDIIRRWRFEAAQMASAPGRVGFHELLRMLNIAGYFFIVIPIALTIRGIVKAHKHPSNKTKRKVTVETLPWIMSNHSPAIIPSLYYGDPNTLLLNDDPIEHRSAIHPDEWVREHGLVVNRRLDKARCLELLKQDLGNPVESIQELSATERAMFAVFATRLFSEGKELKSAQALLDALNRSCHTNTFEGKKGYPALRLADATFAKYADHPQVRAWLDRHPYPRTLLYSMHLEASKSGKLPSSQFRWLKGMDRPLFYALNLGLRKAPFLEASAVFTQKLWEDYAFDTGYRLTEPCLDDAVIGIQTYLQKIGIVEESGVIQ